MEINEKNNTTRLTRRDSYSKIEESLPASTRPVPYEVIRELVLKKRGDKRAGLRAKLARCWNNTEPDSRDRQHVENIIYCLETKRHYIPPDSQDRRLLTRLDKN